MTLRRVVEYATVPGPTSTRQRVQGQQRQLCAFVAAVVVLYPSAVVHVEDGPGA